jgi:hypothetical protein
MQGAHCRGRRKTGGDGDAPPGPPGGIILGVDADGAEEDEEGAKTRKELSEALCHTSDGRYSMLFSVLEAQNVPDELHGKVWQSLMAMPTAASRLSSIEEQRFTDWSTVYGPEVGPWRSLYALQIVDMLMMPAGGAVELSGAVQVNAYCQHR